MVSVPLVRSRRPPLHRYRVQNRHPRLALLRLPPSLLPVRLAAAPHAPTLAGHHTAAYCTAGEGKEGETKKKKTNRMMQVCNGQVRGLGKWKFEIESRLHSRNVTKTNMKCKIMLQRQYEKCDTVIEKLSTGLFHCAAEYNSASLQHW